MFCSVKRRGADLPKLEVKLAISTYSMLMGTRDGLAVIGKDQEGEF